MTLDQFLERLTIIRWQRIPGCGEIRTKELFPADPDRGEEAMDTRCPLAAIAECYSEIDVEDFAEKTGLDMRLCQDIISAADHDGGWTTDGNPRPFTDGRHVDSLPDLRVQLLRACGLTPIHI